MPDMGKHTSTEAVKIRARVCAWLVFISMAGTTMSFQVYHSIEHGQMPWPLAVLYGVVPLFISMLVIEFASGDDAPKWIQWAAYLIIGGAMYLSAAATGAVVLRAAPEHSSLLFGLLLDGAAILAARFLMTAAKLDAAAKRVSFEAALEAERAARHNAEAGLEAAQADAAEATQKAEALALQLADTPITEPGTAGGRGSGTAARQPTRRKSGTVAPRRTKDAAAQAAEVVTHAEAELILAADPEISGSELGRRLGTTPGYGRTLKRKLTQVSQGGEG
jgi:hypothetical protein